MSLHFDPTQGLIVVPTRLFGPAGDIVRLALDTGATRTVVSWDVVVLVGYDPAVAAQRVQMTTGSGVEFVPQLIVEKIEALGQERRDFPVSVTPYHPRQRSTGYWVWTFCGGSAWLSICEKGECFSNSMALFNVAYAPAAASRVWSTSCRSIFWSFVQMSSPVSLLKICAASLTLGKLS